MSGLICTLLGLYLLVLLVRIVMSWFPVARGGTGEQILAVLHAITEPVLAPFRRLIPPVRMGGAYLDLSPIVVFFGIQILRAAVC